VFVYTVALAFKANCINKMFVNIQTQFTICTGSIYFMLKLLVCPKQPRAAYPSTAYIPDELIYLSIIYFYKIIFLNYMSLTITIPNIFIIKMLCIFIKLEFCI